MGTSKAKWDVSTIYVWPWEEYRAFMQVMRRNSRKKFFELIKAVCRLFWGSRTNGSLIYERNSHLPSGSAGSHWRSRRKAEWERRKNPSWEGSECGPRVYLASSPSKNKTHKLLVEGSHTCSPAGNREKKTDCIWGKSERKSSYTPGEGLEMGFGLNSLGSQNTKGAGLLRRSRIQCWQKQGWVSIALLSVKESRLQRQNQP